MNTETIVILFISTMEGMTTTTILKSIVLDKSLENKYGKPITVENLVINNDDDPTVSIDATSKAISRLNPKFIIFCDFYGEVRLLDLCKECIRKNKSRSIIYIEKSTFNSMSLETEKISIIPNFVNYQDLTEKIIQKIYPKSQEAAA